MDEWVLIALGLLAIVGLSLIIRKQLHLLQAQKVAEEAMASRMESQKQSALDSAVLIAHALLQGQVEPSEAAIRIKVLIDQIDIQLHETPELSIFHNAYERLQHLATHTARKRLDKQVRMRQDQERWRIEAELETAIEQGAKNLIARFSATQAKDPSQQLP